MSNLVCLAPPCMQFAWLISESVGTSASWYTKIGILYADLIYEWPGVQKNTQGKNP